MATHRVEPIKVKKMMVRDIPIGEFFSLDRGGRYIMINPIDKYNEFLANVLLIMRDELGNEEAVPVNIHNAEIAYVRAVVSPRKNSNLH